MGAKVKDAVKTIALGLALLGFVGFAFLVMFTMPELR